MTIFSRFGEGEGNQQPFYVLQLFGTDCTSKLYPQYLEQLLSGALHFSSGVLSSEGI
jgi:hypothetical protein